jgi:hypothetical protein
VPVATEHSVRDRVNQIVEAAKSTFSIEETPCGSLASVHFFRLDRMVIGERHQQKRDLGANRIGYVVKEGDQVVEDALVRHDLFPFVIGCRAHQALKHVMTSSLYMLGYIEPSSRYWQSGDGLPATGPVTN